MLPMAGKKIISRLVQRKWPPVGQGSLGFSVKGNHITFKNAGKITATVGYEDGLMSCLQEILDLAKVVQRQLCGSGKLHSIENDKEKAKKENKQLVVLKTLIQTSKMPLLIV